MSDQTYMSPSSGLNPYDTNGNGHGGFNLPVTLILAVLFALGTAIFGYLAWHFSATAQTATTTLHAQTTAAANAAASAQKKQDEKATAAANEIPFRAFVAPDLYGNFVINFPKNWSSWLNEVPTGSQQVVLILNPDFVTVTNGVPGLAAAKVTLIQEAGPQFISSYTSYIRNGQIKQASITIAGQTGYDFTGKFPNQRSVREVVIPVRDSVIVFDNENSQYASEFSEILAQAKIVP